MNVNFHNIVAIYHSKFNQQKSYFSGGAFHIEILNSIILKNSLFSFNFALNQGGSIYSRNFNKILSENVIIHNDTITNFLGAGIGLELLNTIIIRNNTIAN